MRDRTDEMRDLVVSNFPQLEFIPARLEDAFDDTWWKKMGAKPANQAFNIDMSNEGNLHLIWPYLLNSHRDRTTPLGNQHRINTR